MTAVQSTNEENVVELTVDLNIPIPTEPTIATPQLTFHRWLPIGLENGIRVSVGKFESSLLKAKCEAQEDSSGASVNEKRRF